MKLRPSPAARQTADVPTTHAGDHTAAETTGSPPGGHPNSQPPDPHPAPVGPGRTRHRRNRPAAARVPQRPDTTAQDCPDTTAPDPGASADAVSPVQKIMHARLQAMAQPRDGDSPRLARLRAVLRNRKIMSRVVANVDSWPELTEQEWAEAIALLRPRRDW